MSESGSNKTSTDETDAFINALNNIIRGVKNVQLTNDDETSDIAKIIEFSNWFSNTTKSLLKVNNDDEYVSLLYHLTNLKENISLAIDSLGKSLSNANVSRRYECVVCSQPITINSNMWDSLVSHEHFEQLYIDLIQNNLTFVEKSNPARRRSQRLLNKKSSDLDRSGPVRQSVTNDSSQSKSDGFPPQSPNLILSISSTALTPTPTPSWSPTPIPLKHPVTDDGPSKDPVLDVKLTKPSQLNGYKFNFQVSYDALISDVLYPDALMKIVSKHDGSDTLMIRKNSRSSATCLLCLCDLIVQSKDLSRNQVLNHVCGNRHLKNVTNTELLANVRNYHDFFVKQEVFLQAQGIFFIPQTPTMIRCVLCKVGMYMGVPGFESHIKSSRHQNLVRQTYVTNLTFRKYSEIVLGILAEYYQFEVVENDADKRRRSSTEVEGQRIAGSPVKNAAAPKPAAGPGPGPNRRKNRKSEKSDPQTEEELNEAEISIKKVEVIKHLQNKLKGPAHKTVRAYTNLKSANLEDILPNRYREHAKFFEKTAENKYLCVKCQQVVAFDVWQINWHIRSSMHHEKTQTYPVNYTYVCGICERPFEKESTYELHLRDFLDSHKKSTALFGESLTEYECLDCYMVVYGDSISLMKHSIRANKKKREIKLPENVKSLFCDVSNIESEGERMRADANRVVDQNYATSACCRALMVVVSELYPKCRAYPFGSRISGFGDAHSDLDVFMDIGDMYDGTSNQDTKSQVLLVKTVASLLNKYRNEFDQIASIPTARTPIIKVMHKITSLDCDMSFRHGLSVENTKFLKYCIKVQPILQPSVLLLKRWSEMCKFREHISTYALAMMTIFFMQIHNYLPAVSKLRDMSDKPNVLIDGWHRFDDSVPIEVVKKEVTSCDVSLKDFLCGFFRYYSEFDFDNDVICPVVGFPVNKSSFDENGTRLPATEMRTYILKLHDTAEPELFRNRSYLCIQDPFDLSHNLTKACQYFIVEQLKKLSTLMWKHLQALK